MSKTAEFKISEKRLREIVFEELARKKGTVQTESVDADGVKTVINASSKLLKAAVSFKEQANIALQNALGSNVDQIIRTLEQIIQNPSAYTDRVKVEPKRVKLRRVKEAKSVNEAVAKRYVVTVKSQKGDGTMMALGGREDLSFALSNVFGRGRYRIVEKDGPDVLNSKRLIVIADASPNWDPDLDVKPE